MSAQHWLDVGKISGAFGIKGWVKVNSYTEKTESIIDYKPWFLSIDGQFVKYGVSSGARHGRGLIVKLETIDTREQSLRLSGTRIFVSRDQFEPTAEHEYYWADLVGLTVFTPSGEHLGCIDYLIETGANDVLVVKGERERLIPFIQGQVINSVDLDARKIVVTWDPQF